MKCFPDNLMRQLMERFIYAQAERLTAHLNGAKDRSDIEDVHQVRVACRRLRSGLAFFGDCFDDGKADRWRKQLKKVLKRLGPARDADVHIVFLEKLLQDRRHIDKQHRPGIARLLLRLRQQRDAEQAGVTQAVSRLQRQRLPRTLVLETERLAKNLDCADRPYEIARFYDRAESLVGKRVDEVLEKRTALDNPADPSGHHALRIAIKKLRYTLELCDVALDGRLKRIIKRLKKLQTLLGDVHDCDVWEGSIEMFITEETRRTEVYFGKTSPMRPLLVGLRFLQSRQREQRRQLFEETAERMGKLDAAGFRDEIRRAVAEDARPCQSDTNDTPDNDREAIDEQTP